MANMSDGRPKTPMARARERWRAALPGLNATLAKLDEIGAEMGEEESAVSPWESPDWEPEWRALVDQMSASVRARNEFKEDHPKHFRETGKEWARLLNHRFSEMFLYLIDTIRRDTGFARFDSPSGVAAPISMILVRRSLALLWDDLRCIGETEDDPNLLCEDEIGLRAARAEAALMEENDDPVMTRIRALHVAEHAARDIYLRPDDEVRAVVEKSDGATGPVERRVDFLQSFPLAIAAYVVRQLAQIDDRFQALDFVAVAEAFVPAKVSSKGGKTAGGESAIGAARALASLAVPLGALGFSQKDGEDFDDAVERCRKLLLQARTDARNELKSYNAVQRQ